MVADRKAAGAVVGCGLLCLLFAVLGWAAIRTKSATTDETSHAVIGYLMLYRHDYRVSPDVPPLWEYWIALAMGKDRLHVDSASPEYQHIELRKQMSAFSDKLAYHTPGVDGLELIRSARRMSFLLAIALAALIGKWAWDLAGTAAAIIATFLYCLDPNFLGHGPLVKNDVASALFYLAGAYIMWRVGRRLTWANGAALALVFAAGVVVKFSGVLLAPVFVLSLGWRTISAEPWTILGKTVHTRGRKLAAVLILGICTALTSYLMLWGCYDFRFDAGPDGMQLNQSVVVNRLRILQLRQRLGRDPMPAEVAAWHMPLLTRAIVFSEDHHLLPQAWAEGFIHTQNEDQGRRPGYLMGVSYSGGKWYYFPLAAFFKEPLATTGAMILALIVGIVSIGRSPLKSWSSRWAAIAIGIPAGVFALAALTANINIGLRHAFPVFPFVFIAAGLALSGIWAWRLGRVVICVLAIMLFAETAGAFPNYIAYFNVACSSDRFWLLSDSNLDWGQDLPTLAAWQKKHPNETLYLDYFGRVDPAVYGIRYINLPDGYPFGPPPQLPTGPGVVAVSGTILQQLQDRPADLAALGLSADSKPDRVLGGTIYLFHFDKLKLPMLK